MKKFLHVLSLLKGAKSVLGPSLALLAKDSFQKKCMVSGGFEPAIPSVVGRAADHWAALPVAGSSALLMKLYLLALRTSIQLLYAECAISGLKTAYRVADGKNHNRTIAGCLNCSFKW